MKGLFAHIRLWEVLFWKTHWKCWNYSECCSMMSIWQSTGYFSVYYSRETRASHWKDQQASLAEVLCRCQCVFDSVSRVLCGCSNLLYGHLKIRRHAAGADMTQTQDVCPGLYRQTRDTATNMNFPQPDKWSHKCCCIVILAFYVSFSISVQCFLMCRVVPRLLSLRSAPNSLVKRFLLHAPTLHYVQ